MRKVVLLSLMALLLCAFPTNMRADDVWYPIGNATTTGNMPDPNSHSSSFQMIFTKEELTAAGVQPDGNGNIVIATIVNGDAGYLLDIGFTALGGNCGANRCIWAHGTSSL